MLVAKVYARFNTHAARLPRPQVFSEPSAVVVNSPEAAVRVLVLLDERRYLEYMVRHG